MSDQRLPGFRSPLPTVPRYGHGSRVPGWDSASDLDKDPAEIPDPATTPVPQDLRERIQAHMANYPDRRSAALPALAAAQRVHGWCSPTAIDQVACVMRLTPGYLISVATFYDMLETEPPPEEGVLRHSVYVCTNISCSLRGADELYAAAREAAADDPTLNVRSFECLGACDIAPMASVDGVYVGPLEPADLDPMLEDIRAGRPVLPDKQLARRRVADPGANRDRSAREAEMPAPQPAGGTAGAVGSSLGTSASGTPDLDPGTASFGPPSGEDRPGPSAPLEEGHRQPAGEGEEPQQARSDQDLPHHPPDPQQAPQQGETGRQAREETPRGGAGRGWRRMLGRNRGRRRGP